MAKAFASQSLIGCQLSRHGAASVVQPKQWRASLVSFKPKSVFLEENRCKVIRWSLAGALALGLSLAAGSGFADAKIGVNKPYLLPKEFSPVIDVAGFLSPGQGCVRGNVLNKIYRSQATVHQERYLEYEVEIELWALAKGKSLKPDGSMMKFLGLLQGGFVGFHRVVRYKHEAFEVAHLVLPTYS